MVDDWELTKILFRMSKPVTTDATYRAAEIPIVLEPAFEVFKLTLLNKILYPPPVITPIPCPPLFNVALVPKQ